MRKGKVNGGIKQGNGPGREKRKERKNIRDTKITKGERDVGGKKGKKKKNI